jgi:predicted secreted protein
MAPELELRDPIADSQATLALGARFVIRLTENPTTGFRWHYDLQQPGVVELVTDDYVSEGRQPGSPGCRTFCFRGSLAGYTDIQFTLRRGWESESPVKTLRLSVTVVEP